MTRRCSQCSREKPESNYLRFPNARVRFCNECAQENMRAYSRGVVTDPDKVRA